MGDRSEITIRPGLRPGDLGAIVRLHGIIYARERGWDATFEAYVAGPLAEFALRQDPRERIWIAERDDRFVGCVAVVSAGGAAQLRWLLVDPSTRGTGLGRRLLRDAIAFAASSGYARMTLWTERAQEAAIRLYEAEGFRLAEEKPGKRWGGEVVERRYECDLTA